MPEIEVISSELVRRIDSLARATNQFRADAVGDPGAGIYFARQLEYIYPEVLRAKLPTLNAMRLFPVDTSVPAGAESFTQRMLEPLGVAEWISNEADDLPFVDVAGTEDLFRLKECGAAYKYTIGDIARGSLTGVNLSTERGIAARRAVEEKQNRTFWYGDASVGIYGVVNYPYTPRFVFSNPISPATSADDIIAEINSFVSSVVITTKETERPTKLLLATTPYSYIATTPRSTTTDTTILEFLIKTNPWIDTVESVHELENAGGANRHMAMAYSPEMRTGRLVVAQPFTQLPAQERNLAFIINTYSKIGGYASSYPLANALAEIPLA